MAAMMKPIPLILILSSMARFSSVAAAEAPPLEPSALLREATARATRVDDPGYLLERIAWAAQPLEKGEALRVLQGVAMVLEEKGPPLGRHSRWAILAAVAAPLNTSARDRYLRRAVAEADAALARAELWKAQLPPAGVIPYWPPEEQAAQQRKLLVFGRELWSALLEAQKDERGKRLTDLLHRTGKAGYFGGDAPTEYRIWYLTQWAGLDPSTFLAVAPREVPEPELAPLATQVASDLTNRYGYNASAKVLIEWAAGKHEMGMHERELLREYELRGRWDEAWKLEPGEERAARLEAVIRDRASYNGPSSDGDVAYRWASEVDDPALRERLQRAAEATAYVSNMARGGRGAEPALTDEERDRQRKAMRAKFDPKVIRILEQPHDVSWLKDDRYTRVQMLSQAAGLAWRENQDWAAVQPILDAIPTQDERDAVLVELAQQGRPPAAEALRHIDSDRLWAAAATSAAEAVAKRQRSGE
jgi:hypothetical protein